MATAYLHGNHKPCPACALRREAENTTQINRLTVPCNMRQLARQVLGIKEGSDVGQLQ